MAGTENNPDADQRREFTGRDVLYRDGAISALDVQRAADALLRQGTKPSVAALREQLGGGSPNTITPLLAKYWETLGTRLGAGPESLERVPENLARVTELLWRRALDEARERLKILGVRDEPAGELVRLQEQLSKLSVALAEARAREGEQLTHLASLSRDRETLRTERASLLALLNSTQALLEQQNARVAALERARSKQLSPPARPSKRPRSPRAKAGSPSPRRQTPKSAAVSRKRSRARKPK
jgi:Plasmid replication region DNA-binding N-term